MIRGDISECMRTPLDRRTLLASLAGVGATWLAARSHAQPKPAPAAPEHDKHTKPAKAPAPAAPTTPVLQAIIDSTASCLRDGRVCLARCTDHLAAGMSSMDKCQRTVMNMLAVTEAMANVAGFRNADPKHIQALAAACASFCRACAAACEPHKDHHEECKACLNSCLTCAKACEAYKA